MATLRFFFEYGVDTVLWPENVDSPLGYPCDSRLLPVSEETRVEIDRLADRYQASLDWNDPSATGPWTTQECESFNAQAESLLVRIRSELPAGWTVEDQFHRV